MNFTDKVREDIRNLLNGNININIDNYKISKCENCGEYELEEYLVDTEGMINGGIGYICENCLNDIRD